MHAPRVQAGTVPFVSVTFENVPVAPAEPLPPERDGNDAGK